MLLNDHWAQELRSLPMLSRKKGRMVELLKQKSKLIVQRKDRKTYELADVFKRRKVQDDSGAQIPGSGSAGVQIPGAGAAVSSGPKQPVAGQKKETKVIKPTIIEKFDDPMGGNK